MEFLAQGRNYHQIGRMEGVTWKGILQRVDQICAKLGARNPVEALKIYLNVRKAS